MSQETQPSSISVFLSPIQSIGFLLSRPHLLGLSILPVILNILLFLVLSYLGYTFLADPLADRINVGGQTVSTILGALLRLMMTIALLVISGLLAFILIIPLSAPFCDLVSEKIEKELLADRKDLLAPEQTIMEGIIHSVKDAFQRIVFVLPIILVFLLLGWIPFIGPPLASFLGFINAAVFLSIDAYSYSMDRRQIRFREKWEFLTARKGIWIPLGLGLSAFMLIPCNIVFLPVLSAVSGTRQYCEAILREEAGSS